MTIAFKWVGPHVRFDVGMTFNMLAIKDEGNIKLWIDIWVESLVKLDTHTIVWIDADWTVNGHIDLATYLWMHFHSSI